MHSVWCDGGQCGFQHECALLCLLGTTGIRPAMPWPYQYRRSNTSTYFTISWVRLVADLADERIATALLHAESPRLSFVLNWELGDEASYSPRETIVVKPIPGIHWEPCGPSSVAID